MMWLFLLGPPLLWSVRFMIVYALIEVACRSGQPGAWFSGLPLVAWLNLGLGLATVAATAWLTQGAYRAWRAAPAGDEAGLEAGEGRRRLLAVAGFGIGLLMIFVTVLEVLPVFFLAPCRLTP